MAVVPATFQRLRALRALNVVGVGVSLAAVVAAAFTQLFHGDSHVAIATGLPTALIGMFWAAILRSRATLGRSSIRVGWAASLPLASLNAAVASALFFATRGVPRSGPDPFTAGLIGATYGAIFWIPALIGTLVCFGAPIAHAQKLAKKGLAGEERGEWIVGVASVVMSMVALLVALPSSDARDRMGHGGGRPVTMGLASLGLVVGAVAASLALSREARRRRFVKDVSAGRVEGYRVDALPEGKVLVRIATQGKGYRVADFEQDVYELSEEGEAQHPKTLEVESPTP